MDHCHHRKWGIEWRRMINKNAVSLHNRTSVQSHLKRYRIGGSILTRGYRKTCILVDGKGLL